MHNVATSEVTPVRFISATSAERTSNIAKLVSITVLIALIDVVAAVASRERASISTVFASTPPERKVISPTFSAENEATPLSILIISLPTKLA